METLQLIEQQDRRPLSVVNPGFADIDFAERRILRHPNAQGRIGESALYLPPNPRPNGRLPLVVLVYPGVSGARSLDEPGGFTTASNVQVLTGAGYAVLRPQLPLSDHPGRPSQGLAAHVSAAVDAVLAANPELDPNAVALWGHSFGGYAVLMIAAQDHRYRSVIASAAATDLAAIWGEFSPVSRVTPDGGLSIGKQAAWAETGQGDLGGPPWTDPESYIRESPLYQANLIDRPVLLIHGDWDPVPLGQAELMFSALHRQNKDARLVTYWGEGHILNAPANVRDAYAQIIDWLKATLQPEPPFTEPNALPIVEPTFPSPSLS